MQMTDKEFEVALKLTATIPAILHHQVSFAPAQK